MPRINGLSKEYLAQSMANYASGARFSPVMGDLAKGYNAEQVALIAEYIAAQPWVPAEESLDPAKVEQGEKLHTNRGCAGCHGQTGIAPVATTPRLAGQSVDYLVLQLKYYQDPDVAVPPMAMSMRFMLKDMSEDDQIALAQFYSSQR
jgi:cytochrome c553